MSLCCSHVLPSVVMCCTVTQHASHSGGRRMEDYTEWSELHKYVNSVRDGRMLATNMMLKGISVTTEPYAPFYVTGMYPSAREGYTLIDQVCSVFRVSFLPLLHGCSEQRMCGFQVVEWSADRYYAFFHENDEPRSHPIFTIGCAVDSCGVEAGAMAFNATPHQADVDDGVVYLGLDTPGFRFVAPYFHELPYISYADWDHVSRNDRKVLDNARHQLVWGVRDDPITGELELERASFGTFRRLKERIADGGFLDAITNINPFHDHNSDAANILHSERTTEPLLKHLDLPNARATLLQLEAGRLNVQPIRDPNFGDPFEAHLAVWTGMFLFALQRQIASAVLKKFKEKLPEKLEHGNLTTTDETFRTHELMTCATSCHLLACKRHGRSIPWNKKVTDTPMVALCYLCLTLPVFCAGSNAKSRRYARL